MIVLAHALELAARGLHVIPIEPRGKRPVIANWPRRATTDHAQLARWFRGGATNLAIVCGPSRVVAIDVDRHGADGYATLAAIEREIGELPPTWTADSGGGGAHYVYRAPPANLVPSAGLGIDVLSGRRYVLVEPSVHPSGRAYAWREGSAPWDRSLTELSPVWIERLKQRRERMNAPMVRAASTTDAADVYAALAQIDQGVVLLRISGSPLVAGEVITLSAPNRRGHRAIVVDGRTTGGFVDGSGKIVHRPTHTQRPDGGPLASTWCRYYGHGDAMIRWMLIDLVPELSRFARTRRTNREASPADLRGDR